MHVNGFSDLSMKTRILVQDVMNVQIKTKDNGWKYRLVQRQIRPYECVESNFLFFVKFFHAVLPQFFYDCFVKYTYIYIDRHCCRSRQIPSSRDTRVISV